LVFIGTKQGLQSCAVIVQRRFDCGNGDVPNADLGDSFANAVQFERLDDCGDY
jgi:hypothetical protein